MKRCTLVLPDAGPFNSLWVADRLDLLLKLEMKIVVVDVVYDDLTSDLAYQKDREVKAFVDNNSPPFIIERTDIGDIEREKRRNGKKLKKNAGEIAMTDFLSDGLEKYLSASEPVMILFEDSGLRVFNKPPNLHLLSTVGLLKGMEAEGFINSAEAIIHEMTHPSKPGRRPEDARKLTDVPDGTDEPAAIGSRWTGR